MNVILEMERFGTFWNVGRYLLVIAILLMLSCLLAGCYAGNWRDLAAVHGWNE
jgi:hypothetical protein